MGRQAVRLSAREGEVARLVADGLTNRAIATRLCISERTVESHLERIRKKLDFHHRSELAAWIARQTGSPSGSTGDGSLPALGTAHDRDRRADDRERRADDREVRADQREADLDERERLLAPRELRVERHS